MNRTSLGYLLTLLSALAFAAMSLFIKLAYGVGMSPWSFSVIQSAFALIMLGTMLLREGGSTVRGGRKPWGRILLFVACGTTSAISFNVALLYLTMSLSTILLFTYPAFVAVGAWLVLGQRPTNWHLAALAMTLVGAVLTVDLSPAGLGSIHVPGVALALLAAAAHAMYIVFGEQVSVTLSATQATTLTRAAILLGSAALSPGIFREIGTVSWEGWLVCLVAALFCGVAPFLFLNRGLALIGANRAAIASVSELPFALLLGMAFLGDVTSLFEGAGALLITAAVVVSQRTEAAPVAQ